MKRVWFRATSDTHIGDNFLFFPVVEQFAMENPNTYIYWVVNGAARTFIDYVWKEKNITLVDNAPDFFGVDLKSAKAVWENDLGANELWCPYNKVLKEDWDTNNLNQLKLVELLYGIKTKEPARTFTVESGLEKQYDLCVAPDAYQEFNQIPLEWLQELGNRYNCVFIYGDKNAERYAELAGDHFAQQTPLEIHKIFNRSELFVGGMTGLTHFANHLGIRSACVSLYPKDWNFFRPYSAPYGNMSFDCLPREEWNEDSFFNFIKVVYEGF